MKVAKEKLQAIMSCRNASVPGDVLSKKGVHVQIIHKHVRSRQCRCTAQAAKGPDAVAGTAAGHTACCEYYPS